MKSAASRRTTSALDPTGRSIHFDDLVGDGEIVEVEGRRMVVVYEPEAPDWFIYPELLGRERPPEHVFEEFRRIYGC